MPGFAVKMAKHSINFGYDLALDNACRIEAECCAQCFSTDDQKEGMKAFLEKRKPVFTGKIENNPPAGDGEPPSEAMPFPAVKITAPSTSIPAKISLGRAGICNSVPWYFSQVRCGYFRPGMVSPHF